ncbi:hypothetical protein HDV00_006358 [Rhizophlyctis rosea]|nr:hypothetical protein HDV00_006358 [Rhizophlyctis rosea]
MVYAMINPFPTGNAHSLGNIQLASSTLGRMDHMSQSSSLRKKAHANSYSKTLEETKRQQAAHIRPKTHVVVYGDRSASTGWTHIKPTDQTLPQNLQGVLMEATRTNLYDIHTTTKDLETEVRLHYAVFNHDVTVVASDKILADCDIDTTIRQTPPADCGTEYAPHMRQLRSLLDNIDTNDAVMVVFLTDDSGCNTGAGYPVAVEIANLQRNVTFVGIGVGNGQFLTLKAMVGAFGAKGVFQTGGMNSAGTAVSTAAVTKLICSQIPSIAHAVTRTLAGSYQLHTNANFPSTPRKRAFTTERIDANNPDGCHTNVPVTVTTCEIPDGLGRKCPTSTTPSS